MAATGERMRRGTWRRWTLVLLLIAAAFRLGGVAGLVRPIRVISESMAPCLIGTHYSMRCVDCDALLRVDAMRFRPGDKLVCWNCGYAANRGLRLTVSPGDRVCVDRFAYQWRPPQRWDVVALRTDDGDVLGKRVLGFPGERLGFEDGDLVINGKRIQKTASQRLSTRILIHDSEHQPSLQGSPRSWNAADKERWHEVDLAWHATVNGPMLSDFAWLRYSHLDADNATTAAGRIRQPAPVHDDLNYNGNRLRGTVHAVPDVWMEAKIKCSADAVLALLFRTATKTWRAEVDARRQVCTMWEGDRRLMGRKTAIRAGSRRAASFEWGLCDRRLFLRIDGRCVFARDVDLPVPAGSHAHPFEVGIRHGDVWVGRRRIWRDVYYFGPDPTAPRWQAPHRLAGLFIAGDNQQASIDSRMRGDRLARETRLWGRVIRMSRR